MFLSLRIDVQHLSLHHFQLFIIWITEAVYEAVPVFLIHGREVSAAVVARPTGLFTEEDGTGMSFGLPHTLDIFPAAQEFVEILSGQLL